MVSTTDFESVSPSSNLGEATKLLDMILLLILLILGIVFVYLYKIVKNKD